MGQGGVVPISDFIRLAGMKQTFHTTDQFPNKYYTSPVLDQNSVISTPYPTLDYFLNHTLHSGTCPYSFCESAPPPLGDDHNRKISFSVHTLGALSSLPTEIVPDLGNAATTLPGSNQQLDTPSSSSASDLHLTGLCSLSVE